MLTFEILIIAGLILLNGFFAMAEMALVSAKRARLQSRAARGSRGARMALALLEDPSGLLSAVQVGITLIGIFTGVYSGAALAEPLVEWVRTLPVDVPYDREIAFTLVVLIVTYGSLVFGELVPKRVALTHAETIAIFVAPIMRVFARALSPLVWLLRFSTEAIVRLLPVTAAPAASVTEDELRALLTEGTKSGVFHAKERRLIEGALALADRSVTAIMVPRQDVIWLDLDEPLEALWRQASDSGHARFLVARGDLESLAGMITLARLSEALRRGQLDEAADIEPPLHVPDSLTVLQLLDQFQNSPVHLAVVTDEYGAIEGVVTPADILRMIAGEWPDVGSRERAELQRREDGSWLVDGHLAIDDLQRELERHDMTHPSDYHTVAGFALAKLGRVPRAGDTFTWRDLRVEIIDMDGTRIDKLLVAVVPARASAGGDNASELDGG
jgi:putative hemolysin